MLFIPPSLPGSETGLTGEESGSGICELSTGSATGDIGAELGRTGAVVMIRTGVVVPEATGADEPVATGMVVPVATGAEEPVLTGVVVPTGAVVPVLTGVVVPTGAEEPVLTGVVVGACTDGRRGAHGCGGA